MPVSKIKKDSKKVFHDYHIKVKRDIFPRFRLESYVKKLLVLNPIKQKHYFEDLDLF